MDFFTASEIEPNIGQTKVWGAVQTAFSHEDGLGFLNYPLYRRDGLLLHTPDILLILRRYGIFVFECKGCRISNIHRIDGPRWSMQAWHSEIESPVDQANNQMFALKNVLELEPTLTGKLRFHARVALPLIRKEEWDLSGFGQLPSAGNVLTQEECMPQRLIELVETCYQKHPQPALDETQWAILKKHFQGGTQKKDYPGSVTRYVYQDLPPTAETLANNLGITLDRKEEHPPSYTYITATAALASRRKREGFGLQHQVAPHPRPNSPEPEKPHLMFHHVLRILLNTPVLTRAEEQTLVARAAHAVADSDKAAAAALRRDVFAWRDALRELDENGFDLRQSIPTAVTARIVHPQVAQVLMRLQQEYYRLQNLARKRPFEAAARNFLENIFRPTPLIIMEGFSRFTPLQKLFIDKCLQHGAKVVFIHPYSFTQARGFEAIQETYANWWAEPPLTLPNSVFKSIEPLSILKTHLFGSPPYLPLLKNSAITVHEYIHRNSEVANCVQLIKKYLEQKWRSSEITIISRDPAGYAPLLLEEAELQGKADLFDIPPKNLLLTPLGRFVLTLYSIWEEGALILSAEAFETILASGWLGSKAQASVEDFAMVVPQMFERCQSYNDWIRAFDHAKNIKTRENSRLPIAAVSNETGELWETILNQIVGLCQRLFDAGQRSIGEHIRLLLDELEQLNQAQIRVAERQVLVRIEEVLKPLVENSSIEITTSEFGAIIARLGYEEPEEDEDEYEKSADKVKVTSPEGIDCTERQIVFYLGVDDRRLPRPYNDPWPLYDNKLAGHSIQERYLFLSSIRATTKHLHLSYALAANNEPCRPSLYLEEATKLIGLPIEKELSAASDDSFPEEAKPVLLNGNVWRSEYSIHEIAHFFLCPYRYQLERLDPKARLYHIDWQMPFVAKAAWLYRVLLMMHMDKVTAERPSDFLAISQEYVIKTERKIRQLFEGLRDLDWLKTHYEVERELTNFFSKYLTDEKNSYQLSIEKSDNIFYSFDIDDRDIQVTTPVYFIIKAGKIRYPFLSIPLDEEWLRFGKKEKNRPANQIAYTNIEGIELFESLYDAVKWWHAGMNNAINYKFNKDKYAEQNTKWIEELKHHITVLQMGNFPKHSGEHCMYCPVRNECLGLNP